MTGWSESSVGVYFPSDPVCFVPDSNHAIGSWMVCYSAVIAPDVSFGVDNWFAVVHLVVIYSLGIL